MKQKSFAASGFEILSMIIYNRVFFDEMKLVFPWTELAALIEPHAPSGKTGRPHFAVSALLCIHFMPQWLVLSDITMC
jgi:IS5 family transposase